MRVARVQVLKGDVVFEVQEEIRLPGWEESMSAPQRLLTEKTNADAWMLKNLTPCLQWSLPLLHYPSR